MKLILFAFCFIVFLPLSFPIWIAVLIRRSYRAEIVRNWRWLPGTCQHSGYGTTDVVIPIDQTKTCHPVGLYNNGNTCYFNAVLQSVKQTTILEDILPTHPLLTDRPVFKFSSNNDLNEFLSQHQDREIFVLVDKPSSCGECCEFVAIFDKLSDSNIINDYNSSSNSISNCSPLFVKLCDGETSSPVLHLHRRGTSHEIFPPDVAQTMQNVYKFVTEEQWSQSQQCYSGCLQLLDAIDDYFSRWFDDVRTISPSSTPDSITQSLQDCLKLMSSRKYCVDPGHLFNVLSTRSRRFRGGNQQDSHELLRHLMDGVKEEEKMSQFDASCDNSQPYRRLTVVDKVFGGHNFSVFCCGKCNTPYHLFEPFLDISLPVVFDHSQIAASEMTSASEAKTSRTSYWNSLNGMLGRLSETGRSATRLSTLDNDIYQDSVVNSLRYYTRCEQLDEYMCLECNQAFADDCLALQNDETKVNITRAVKQTVIYNPPAILVIHLKRFQKVNKTYIKVSEHVKFEQQLDLGPFCSQYSLRRQPDARQVLYALYGVVVHSGTLDGGHYTACVRARRRVDLRRTEAFLQQTFTDRDELMGERRLVELLQSMAATAQNHSSTAGREQHQQLQPVQQFVEVKPLHDIETDSGDWYEISDTSVSLSSWQRVQTMKAYLLFYERIN